MRDEIRERMVALLPRLRRFAFSLTGNAEQSDDLVQDACVRALARIDQWQPGTRLNSWMYRIAQNIWLDRVRANKVRGEVVDIEAAEGIVGSDGRVVAESELTLQTVAAALARLPAEQRAVVALVCIEGASYKEAAGDHRGADRHRHEQAGTGAARPCRRPQSAAAAAPRAARGKDRVLSNHEDAGEKAMALVDGRLAPAEVPELVQELARSPALVAELQAYLATAGRRMAEPFEAKLSEPPPAWLVDAVMRAPTAPEAAGRSRKPVAQVPLASSDG